MVRELRMRAIEGLLALPRRGIEVGGVLFGETTSTGLRLTAFEEVPCEHLYGPSYALSEADRTKLKELLSERAARDVQVVGFFRSFTSREPVVEAADEQLVREHFPTGFFVFLMLQPRSADNCVASLRFMCDGRLLPESDDLPVVFDPRRMPVVEPPSQHGAILQSEPAPEPEPEPVRMETPARMEMPPRMETPVQAEAPPAVRRELPARPWTAMPLPSEDRPKPIRWKMVALICLLSLLGGAMAAKLWIAARAEQWTELHLDARPRGDALEVTWDASAPRALDATKGLLAVTDGGKRIDIPLTPAQLRTGKYAYVPSHPDVALRLILYSQGRGAAGDAVRVAMAPPVGEADRSPAVAVSRVPSSPTKAAAPHARAAAAAVPPSAVHEVQPNIPAGIRSRISSEIVIPVEVQIDERGQVVRAQAKSRSAGSVERYLSAQAQKAAREWRFTPARSGAGEPVPGSKTIRFVFTP
jgi:hypothetical protein